MNQELVSVMVPVRNEEDYISDCLNSIFSQSYQNIELLIGEDCSTDNTLEIIQSWVKEHSSRFVRCEVFAHEKNYGITKNFNSLLKMAKGKYLKSIAGDDIIMPDGIKDEVEFYCHNPETDILYANAYIIHACDKYPLKNTENYKLFYDKIPVYEDGLTEALFRGDVIAAPTVMLTDQTIKKFGLYDETLAFEDWEYWLRVATGDGNINYLNSPVVGYRKLEFSDSHHGKGKEEEKKYNRILESEEKLLLKYRPLMKNKSMDEYWNRTLKYCIDRDYNQTVKTILKTKEFNLDPRSKLMVFSYRTHTYWLTSKIWMKIRHGL